MTSQNLADVLRPAETVNGSKWAAPVNPPYAIADELPLTPGVRPVEPPPHQLGRFVMEFE